MNMPEQDEDDIYEYSKDQFITNIIKDGGDEQVATFIGDFLYHEGLDGVETIRHLFRAGYCLYFAYTLLHAFGRGRVCYAYDHGHFVWEDTDGVTYDIEGVNKDWEQLVPVEKLGKMVDDFKHVPGVWYGATREEIDKLVE